MSFQGDSSRARRLHLLVGQAAWIGENGQRITSQRCSRENIKLNEFVPARHLSVSISQLSTLNSQLL